MSYRCNSLPYSDWLLCVPSRLSCILPRWSLLMLSRRIGAQVGRTRVVCHMARALGQASIAELVASVNVETGWLQSDMDDWLLCGLLDVSAKWAASLPNITFALRSKLQPSKPMLKACSCIGPFLVGSSRPGVWVISIPQSRRLDLLCVRVRHSQLLSGSFKVVACLLVLLAGGMATVGGALLSFRRFWVGIGHDWLAFDRSIGRQFGEIALFYALMRVLEHDNSAVSKK